MWESCLCSLLSRCKNLCPGAHLWSRTPHSLHECAICVIKITLVLPAPPGWLILLIRVMNPPSGLRFHPECRDIYRNWLPKNSLVTAKRFQTWHLLIMVSNNNQVSTVFWTKIRLLNHEWANIECWDATWSHRQAYPKDKYSKKYIKQHIHCAIINLYLKDPIKTPNPKIFKCTSIFSGFLHAWVCTLPLSKILLYFFFCL